MARPPAGNNEWARYRLPPVGTAREYQLTSEIAIDCVTGLQWQRVEDRTRRSQPDAIAYCEGLSLAGFDDWRAPTYIELMTIVAFGAGSLGVPAIDRTAFPSATDANIWSSSVRSGGAEPFGWYVDFSRGASNNVAATETFLTRCVR